MFIHYHHLVKTTFSYCLLFLLTLTHRISYSFKQTKLYKSVQERIKKYEPTYRLIKLILKAIKDLINILFKDVVKPYIYERIADTKS